MPFTNDDFINTFIGTILILGSIFGTIGICVYCAIEREKKEKKEKRKINVKECPQCKMKKQQYDIV